MKPGNVLYCRLLQRIIIVLFISLISFSFSCSIEKAGSPRFSVSLGQDIAEGPLSGRILLMLSKTGEFDIDENGTPLFGKNVDDLYHGSSVIIDEDVLGYPVKSLKDIPAGEYFVKVIFNKYTTFHRSDGHTIKLHMDQGEGQKWQVSPGNLYCDPVKIEFNPEFNSTIDLTLDRVIPPIPPRTDTKMVKNIKIQSKLLSDFWNHPMHIGARILLPKGYEEHPDAYYPVHYIQGHFPRGNPGGYREDEENSLFRFWNSDNVPRMILVTIEHANPYYDDSYGINSENMGPYGDAIVTELIPEIEKNFRAIPKQYARVLSGGSTGGWISLAMQVWYPGFFGGTWSGYPDQIDFRKYQIVNIYDDKNAYFFEHEWTKVPRPSRRDTDGNITYTMEQENLFEEVIGDRYRSGGQWAVWNALFAPVDSDGYPKPMWNPITGEIDKETAQWAKERYDIRYYLENNWAAVGEKLIGKIHIFCGRMDNYYLNEACYLLEDFLESTKDPYYAGAFAYGMRGGHGWSPWGRENHYVELAKVMADHITKNAPEGENTDLWKY